MNTKQGGIMLNKKGQYLCTCMILGLFLFIFQIDSVRASDLAISGLDITSLAGDKLQIQLEMNGPAVEPKVFHTDNPARIALDFSGVKNALDKKMFPVKQGPASSIYVAEAPDRVRVVVNLIESTPFETEVLGNKVLLTLTRAKIMAPAKTKSLAEKSMMPVAANSVARALIPEQSISGFDFKRGDKGEGRILVYLANPNTIVNSKQEGGKVIISLLNTRLPGNLANRLDVSEFATPVKLIDTVSSSQETTVTVTLQNDLYDYSLFQSEGLLTVEFRALTPIEKEILESKRASTKPKLSLNFQDIEIRSVIAILAEFTGQNIVAGDEVTGNITLKLDDVPWDEALDFIMMTKNLEKFESDTVTLIAPAGKIKDYKEQQQQTAAVVEQLDPLTTEYIKINYARAENFRNLLNGQDTGTFGACGLATKTGSSGSTANYQGQAQGQAQSNGQGQTNAQISGSANQTNTYSNQMITKDDQFAMLSKRGTAVVDARTNTLIVRETPKRLEDIKKLIRKLDVPVRQVMIESRIVIADNSFAKELGVRFGVAGDTVHVNDGTGPVGSVNNLGGTTGTINGTAIVNDALVDLAASNPYGALGMTLARGADYVLNLELSALQDTGRGELVSNPRVMTSDRCNAKIKQGFQVPYSTTSQNGTQIQFIDALLELNVLPQITPSGSITMALNITKDEPGVPSGLDGPPPIRKREIDTTVHVVDGETVVLGGVFESDQRNSTNAVPFFADIPGIGFLFKKNINKDDKQELLIFITPKIVKDNAASN